MDCRKISQLTYDYMDRGLNAETAAAYEKHMLACEECRRALEFERGFLGAVRLRLSPEAAPLGLQSRIQDRIREEAAVLEETVRKPRGGSRPSGVPRERRRSGSGWRGGAAVAAAVLAAAILTVFAVRINSPSRNGKIPVEWMAENGPAPESFERAMLGEVNRWPLKTDYVSLAERCPLCQKAVYDLIVTKCSPLDASRGETVESHLKHCGRCLERANVLMEKYKTKI